LVSPFLSENPKRKKKGELNKENRKLYNQDYIQTIYVLVIIFSSQIYFVGVTIHLSNPNLKNNLFNMILE